MRDCLILGGGPAGYAAALYGARAGLRVTVLERLAAGGQMAEAAMIDNYPGFPAGIEGIRLGARMQESAARFGAATVTAEIRAVSLRGTVKEIETDAGCFRAGAVIAATGAAHRTLGLPREAALTGRGISYCAACDGMFYRGKTVAVVGGGNTAVTDALLLARLARHVYLIHRREALRAAGISRDALRQADNVTFCGCAAVAALHGADRLTGVTLRDTVTGKMRELALDGLFIAIGRTPETALFRGQLTLDEGGWIAADESTATNLPGVFAAGDVRAKAVRQIVTAVADGAAAALAAEAYLSHR